MSERNAETVRLRRGDTVPCSVPEPHAPHIWVAPGFQYPLLCRGYPQHGEKVRECSWCGTLPMPRPSSQSIEGKPYGGIQ